MSKIKAAAFFPYHWLCPEALNLVHFVILVDLVMLKDFMNNFLSNLFDDVLEFFFMTIVLDYVFDLFFYWLLRLSGTYFLDFLISVRVKNSLILEFKYEFIRFLTLLWFAYWYDRPTQKPQMLSPSKLSLFLCQILYIFLHFQI